MPLKSYLWFDPQWPQWKSKIHLLDNKKVIFRNSIVHGQWSYEYDPNFDVGRFRISFHCRGDEERLKDHELVSITGTSSYRLVQGPGGYSPQIVMIPLEP